MTDRYTLPSLLLSHFSRVQLCVTPWTVARQAPLSMGILQGRVLQWVAMPSSRGSSQPRSPTLQADSLPSEPPGKRENTGVGSLPLLQWVFPTQELNQALLSMESLQARKLDWVGLPLPGNFPNSGTKPTSPELQADSLLTKLPGKPKNTGVGSLPLLQGIFLIQ